MRLLPRARQSPKSAPPRLGRWLASLAAVTLASAGIIGCSASAHVSIGGETLNNPDRLVADGLQKSVGERPVSVTCPSDIPGKVGHVFHCHVVINSSGQYVIATVTESSVKGSSVHLHIADGTKIYPGS